MYAGHRMKPPLFASSNLPTSLVLSKSGKWTGSYIVLFYSSEHSKRFTHCAVHCAALLYLSNQNKIKPFQIHVQIFCVAKTSSFQFYISNYAAFTSSHGCLVLLLDLCIVLVTLKRDNSRDSICYQHFICFVHTSVASLQLVIMNTLRGKWKAPE